MLSILIPTFNYNIVKLVKDLHQQALEQYIDFEIIVMEDGSTQFLVENKEIEKFKNCKYIVLDNNIGRRLSEINCRIRQTLSTCFLWIAMQKFAHPISLKDT